MSFAIGKVMFTALVGAGMLAPAAFAGVDPALLAMVPPDSKMLIGIQVSQTQASPFGQYLLSQIQLDPETNKIMTAAGFDPRRDLQEILAASGDGLNGVMLGRGSFQQARIARAALAAGAVSSTYHGITLVGLNGNAKSKVAGSIAFLDASTLAAGDTGAVKALIDRHAAGTGLSGPLADRARQISSANDAWLASLAPSAALGGVAQNTQLGPFENLLQSALQFSAGVKFAATEVTLSAEVLARSAQDAQSMADVLKFLAGMLEASRSQDPNAAPKSKPSIASAPQISASGSTMHVVLAVPEQQIEEFFVPGSKPVSGQPKKVALR
jgi:hypothetical protein